MDGRAKRFLAEVLRLNRSLAAARESSLSRASDLVPGAHRVLLRLQQTTSADLRPYLCKSALEIQGRRSDSTQRIALAFDLCNLASLVVDDILDQAPMRDGRASIHQRFGKEQALLAATLVKCQASLEMVSAIEADCRLVNGFEAIRKFELAYQDLNRGQWRDLVSTARLVGEDDYFTTVELTTGRLFSAALEVGALLAGADSKIVSLLGGIGSLLGVLHQVRDDYVDYWPGKYSIGRAGFEDLKQMRPRLPILRFLRVGHSAGSRGAIKKWRLLRLDSPPKVRASMVRDGVFQYMEKISKERAQHCLDLTAQLPVGSTRLALEAAVYLLAIDTDEAKA